ncbi:hypothetical protein [Clostridium estertheticum]|nr:hypothetical protein [Clostridium estertheticum]
MICGKTATTQYSPFLMKYKSKTELLFCGCYDVKYEECDTTNT